MLGENIRLDVVCAVVLCGLLIPSGPVLGGEPGVLGGPTVAGRAAARTLVHRGLDGEVLPLGAPPAIAALDLFDLDGATRDRVSALLFERAGLLDEVVLKNLGLLSEVETVMAAGTPAEKLTVLQQGLAALEPVRAWGRLEERIAGVLPDAVRGAYLGVIREYEDARFAWAVTAGEAGHRFEYRIARYWEDMGWEIERAAERVLSDDGGDEWLDLLVEKLGLSSSQAGTIRQMAEDFFIRVGGRPTEAEEMAFVAQIRTVMTVEQRWRFLVLMLRGELE